MAEKETTKQKQKKGKFRTKYRLIILNDNTFEEKVSLILSPLNVFTWGGLILFLLILIIVLIIGFIPIPDYFSLKTDILDENKNKFIGIIAGIFAIGLGSYFLRYLKSDTKTKEGDEIDYNLVEIGRSLNKILHGNKLNLDENKIYEIVEDSLKNTITKSVVQNIEKKYSKDIAQSEKEEVITNIVTRMKTRINNEIINMSKRSNLNLVFGIVFSLFAIFTLIYAIIYVEESVKEEVFLISRVSLAVFIQVLAFFFLRIYKSAIEDIKYYQNELTTLETKIIALKASLFSGEKTEVISDVIKEISKTDRNFILKKGESTVNLEQNKLDITYLKELLSKLNLK